MNPLKIFMATLGISKERKSLHPLSFYDLKINDINGKLIDFNNFRGKYVLVVNVASKCGFTSQYKDLQKLYEEFQDRLMIIGVPCNQFGGQEPGDSKEISSFCELNYGVTFLMTEKVDVKGENQHPLYQWLTNKDLNGVKDSNVKWNFQKYLIDPKGNYKDYFFSITMPSSQKIIKYLK